VCVIERTSSNSAQIPNSTGRFAVRKDADPNQLHFSAHHSTERTCPSALTTPKKWNNFHACMPRFLVRGLYNSTLKRRKNIPSTTVMTFLESLRPLLYTNQPQALVAIKYGIVNIINLRVNILSNCQATGHVTYSTIHRRGPRMA